MTNEMDKLEAWLKDNGFDATRVAQVPYAFGHERNQLIITRTYKNQPYTWISIVCQFGSYGYEQGLLELYDFGEDPIGYLTAEQCAEIIKRKQSELEIDMKKHVTFRILKAREKEEPK